MLTAIVPAARVAAPYALRGIQLGFQVFCTLTAATIVADASVKATKVISRTVRNTRVYGIYPMFTGGTKTTPV